MLVERPEINEYSMYLNTLADLKKDLAMLKFKLERTMAHAMKEAFTNNVKTKELDYIKVLGNSKEQEDIIADLKTEIIGLEKQINMTDGKIRVWVANKELYINDSFHQVRGSTRKIAEMEG